MGDFIFLKENSSLTFFVQFLNQVCLFLCKLRVTHAYEHLEKEVKENWIVNFKFVVSIYLYFNV
jgi:hypothetical protein